MSQLRSPARLALASVVIAVGLSGCGINTIPTYEQDAAIV